MKTINELFLASVDRYADNPFLLEKPNNHYVGTSYKEVKDSVFRCAAGLMSLGINKGDRLALLAAGCNNWVISELGILFAGAINVPLSVKLGEPNEIKFRLKHSGTKMVIVSKTQAEKVESIKKDLPELKKIILLDAKESYKKDEIFFNDILLLGDEYLKNNREKFELRYKSIAPDDYANICYTSGTTADPKGIILSHRNYTANVEQSLTLFTMPPHWKTLLILPWDHAFAHTCGIYALMSCGASLASIKLGSTPMETLKNIPGNIKEIQPHFLLSVPSLAKNFKKNIEKAIQEKGPKVEKLFQKALNLAYSYNGNGFNKGKGLKIFKKPMYMLYDKLIFSKIRANFGGNLEFFIGGGALLDIELQRFFYAIGMPMYQGYGLSEASPVISSNNPTIHKMGSSGKIADFMECKICDDDGNEVPVGEKGEIVIQGENVMKGYWQNEEATSETIKGEWLYTGDLGYMDGDGFLYVLGRFKSLLIADDGEKYSPEGIEEALTEQSPYLDQCILYNNQKPYTVILVYPNKEALKRWANENGINITSPEGKLKTLDFIETEINAYRTGNKFDHMFPQRWLPASIGILKEGFTEENQLMNSTLKMVRGKITERYQDLIDYLYTPESKDVKNQRNIEAISKLLG
ncbi:MAG: AMP-binding protein [Bacteroidales bacterium]|nr:AMP-binding protein [Bacteroidales bacterium]